MSENKYMLQLDGLRFIAVSLVMIAHWIAIGNRIYLNSITGPAGVNLFFVLSGFLITGILINNKDSGINAWQLLKQFYIRRFLRIFPLYYLIIFIGIVFFIPGAREYFFWFISYTSNYIIAWEKGTGSQYAHLWSLAVEEQFYIIFPFLVLITPRQHYLKLFYTLAALSIISRIMPYIVLQDANQSLWISYTFTPCCFDSFAIGGILAYYFRYEREKLENFLKYKSIFFSALILYLICSYFRWFLLTRTLYSSFSFWIVGMAALGKSSGIIKIFLENKVVVYLGKITYGLYVYHHFMPWFFQKFGFDERWYIRPLYFVTTVALASLSWFLFEKPINRLKIYFEYNSKKQTLKPSI